MAVFPQLAQMVAVCHRIGAKGWAPAMSGNMSVRQSSDICLISASGKDKVSLTSEDFIAVDITLLHMVPQPNLSTETDLHTLIYRLQPDAGAVVHLHTVNATVLSRTELSNSLTLQGYEMQKTLSEQNSHLDNVSIAIFDNDQDIAALAEHIARYMQKNPLQYGFLLRGHGLTCWGKDVDEVCRHLEGLDFLFECEITRRLLEVKSSAPFDLSLI